MNDPPSGVREATLAYVAQPLDAARAEGDRPRDRITSIVGCTPAMRALHAQLVRFARTTATVVVEGETGTGKELVARALHQLSPRARRPFVAVNVAAVPETLLLSELFGHERGAFTGALARRRGLFEQADGGTLFLDEVGELSFEAQASLLRVLETREVRSLGAERDRPVNVRLVVATHRDLAGMVTHGAFREDLYYRLHTLVLRLPPLRFRTADIPAIAGELLLRIQSEVGERRLDRDALTRLQSYGWPGNVRQLANVLRRAVAQTNAFVLTEADVVAALADEPDARREIREGATAETIRAVLKAEGGRIAPAARRLGMARSTLRERIRRYAIALDGA
ncbi:MAG: sigma-54-dependent Fis family transcriptional regulator [Deltaproteobacteria bacterium]|nr:sigma-54-dependent Fis family transcriptional regulator [Deltaproteobacteria bacterium]